MRSFMRWVDRYCARHPRFGIDGIMKYLVIGNAVIWLLTLMDRTGTVSSYLALNPYMVLRGQVWRLASFALIPGSDGIWNLVALYFYYSIGTVLERQWGQAKFNMYFFSGMVFTIVYSFAAYFITGKSMSVGSSYIYLSMFFSFAAFYPEQQVLLFFILPIKIKWLAYVDGAFFLVSVFTSSFPYNLLPVVAALNFFLFCGDMVLGGFSRSRRQQRQKTVNFKKAAARVRREQENAPYRFKCAVCGRTDTDFPHLEFRYCSRCAGYHCFCQDHISNHIHFTE